MKKRQLLTTAQAKFQQKMRLFLLEAVRKELENDIYKFYVGTSYRHLTIWDKGEVVDLTPPHDVLGQKIGQYLPKDDKSKRDDEEEL